MYADLRKWTTGRCPHTRGGEPEGDLIEACSGCGCPHTRGGEPVVVGGAGERTERCPHTRGGEPVEPKRPPTVREALSPHPWG